MTGSYLVIDFKGKNLTSSATNMKPLYEKLKELDKPVLLKHVTVNSKEYKPAFIQCSKNASNYEFKMADGATIVVDPESNVTATAAAA